MTTSGTGPSRRLRTLTVLIDAVKLADSVADGPAVGEVRSFDLLFLEAGLDQPGAGVHRAHAQPIPTEVPSRGTLWFGPSELQPYWLTVLHGDGWEAIWEAPRPVLGQVEVRGVLCHVLHGYLPTPTRGRVTGVGVITTPADQPADDSSYLLRAVDAAPRWLLDLSGPGQVGPVESGVLVDLDLDDVPPLPLRPVFVPTDLAGHGPDLWAVDSHLPLARRIRAGAVAHRISWPAPVRTKATPRLLHADDHGVWVGAGDGLRRITVDGHVHRHSPDPVWRLAAGATTLAVHGVPDGAPATLQLHTPGRDVTTVPAQHDVQGLVATADDDFLILLAPHRALRPRPDDRRPWLAHLTADGGLTHGPRLDTHPHHLPILLGGPHPLLVDRDRAHPVTGQLTLGDPIGPTGVWRASATTDRVWFSTESSLDNRSVVLTGHDPTTLDELHRHVLPGLPDQVVTTDDALWVRVNGLILETRRGSTRAVQREWWA